MMSSVRRYGLLVLGLLGIAVGVGLLTTHSTSFGWTAYAPLSDATFVPPIFPLSPWGGALLLVGVALVAGWVGHRMGRRRAE